MRALLSRLAAPLAAVRWLVVGLIWGHASWWPAALAQPPAEAVEGQEGGDHQLRSLLFGVLQRGRQA